MYLRKVFRRYLRRFVPVSCYPLLAIPYRWYVRWTISRMGRDDRAYRQEHPQTIAPPPRLRLKVTGSACTIPDFLQGGQRSVADLEAGLRRAGVPLQAGQRALDLGCGCGRLILAFRRKWPGVRLCGADIDSEAIAWCREHIPKVAFLANAPLPPLPYQEESFDLAWTVSVFTHLDEERQFRWLEELHRILKPGGTLIATLHGRNVWEGLPAATRRQIETKGFLYATIAADRGLFPEWYQVAWHTEEYVRRRWTTHFEVLCYIPQGSRNFQDMVVLRRWPTSQNLIDVE